MNTENLENKLLSIINQHKQTGGNVQDIAKAAVAITGLGVVGTLLNKYSGQITDTENASQFNFTNIIGKDPTKLYNMLQPPSQDQSLPQKQDQDQLQKQTQLNQQLQQQNQQLQQQNQQLQQRSQDMMQQTQLMQQLQQQNQQLQQENQQLQQENQQLQQPSQQQKQPATTLSPSAQQQQRTSTPTMPPSAQQQQKPTTAQQQRAPTPTTAQQQRAPTPTTAQLQQPYNSRDVFQPNNSPSSLVSANTTTNLSQSPTSENPTGSEINAAQKRLRQDSMIGGANPGMLAYLELCKVVAKKLNIPNGVPVKKIASKLQKDTKLTNASLKGDALLAAAKKHLDNNLSVYKKMV